jgi:hypothetical protein
LTSSLRLSYEDDLIILAGKNDIAISFSRQEHLNTADDLHRYVFHKHQRMLGNDQATAGIPREGRGRSYAVLLVELHQVLHEDRDEQTI